jgi:3-hydroxy-3-methylglutaryl CoA synthase
MAGIISWGAYIPIYRLRRRDIANEFVSLLSKMKEGY